MVNILLILFEKTRLEGFKVRKSVCVDGGYLPFLAEIIIQYLTTSLVLLGDDIGRSATTMKSGIWW